MNIQMSFEQTDSGKLYVVPTPIGNLEDMTFRAVKTLETVHLIAAEDTRHTQKLLNHFSIETSMISYHEHNEYERLEQLTKYIKQGKNIALVSDAGMPGISDPGHILIKHLIQKKLPVVVLPGANAALCALVGSGLSTDEFLFYGFLPRKKKAKIDALKKLSHVQATIIFYESPYRVQDTIQLIRQKLGHRKVAIARELTKQFETYIRGDVTKVIDWLNSQQIKGECCIIVEGITSAEIDEHSLWWSPLSVVEHVDYYIDQEQLRSKDAIKRVAMDRQMKRRDVYQKYHVH